MRPRWRPVGRDATEESTDCYVPLSLDERLDRTFCPIEAFAAISQPSADLDLVSVLSEMRKMSEICLIITRNWNKLNW